MVHSRIAAGTYIIGVSLICSSALAQGEVTQVRLTAEDPFAVRTVQIILRSGTPAPSLKTIASIDLGAKTVKAVDVYGHTKDIPLDVIDRIECEQAILKRSPMAQESPWKIEVFTGTAQMTRAQNVDLKDGILSLKDLPAPETPASSMPADMSLGPQQTTWELRTIRYVESSRVFEVTLVPTRYERWITRSSGSSLSGSRKRPQ